jgi:hypothetical protein
MISPSFENEIFVNPEKSQIMEEYNFSKIKNMQTPEAN